MRPRIGQYIEHAILGRCIIIAVRAAGTIDIQNTKTGKCYRLTGLAF